MCVIIQVTRASQVVSDEIAHDLVKECADIRLGNVHIPEPLGNIKIDPVTTEGAYEVKLDSRRAQKRPYCLFQLLKVRLEKILHVNDISDG
jgi:hypothetical protein